MILENLMYTFYFVSVLCSGLNPTIFNLMSRIPMAQPQAGVTDDTCPWLRGPRYKESTTGIPCLT
jgi:hypothetical protein